ncbi:MAG: DinB family protein [Candidatus Heimdallarchaeota archaeon]
MSMNEIYQLVRDSKLTPRVALLYSQQEEVRTNLLKMVKDIDDSDLDYTPDERKIETIGTLLLHIAVVEWSWIIGGLEKRELSNGKWNVAFPLRKGVDLPQQVGKGLEYYLEKLKEVRLEVYEKLKGLTDKDLDTVIESGKYKSTVEWMLHHVIEHEAEHLGQISLLKRLYKIKNKRSDN